MGSGGGEERERFITVAIGRGYSFSRKLIKEVKKEQKKEKSSFILSPNPKLRVEPRYGFGKACGFSL